MPEITLSQILLARENRVKTQNELIKAYKKPLICFTMNIAGPIKNSPLIERAFCYGLKRLGECIPSDKILFKKDCREDTGCQAFLCVDMPSFRLKEICLGIENENRLGRLFDMDVIDSDFQKLSRKELRGCLICGKPGRSCAAGRVHSAKELMDITNDIITDFFYQYDQKRTADIGVQSLIQEVYTTPKPGLVDLSNTGSHKDMDSNTFVKSANTLGSYFSVCFEIGQKKRRLPPEDIFPMLKHEGIKAEECMYKATGGINTHKGIIYSMGIICAAIGRLWTAHTPYGDIPDICHMCTLISSSAIKSDFENIDTSTAGGFYYKKLGIKGIRGEALSGFSSVREIALPSYIKALQNNLSSNDAGVFALLNLIANVKDTNLYSRGGADGAMYAENYAKKLLKTGSLSLKAVEEMDREFIKKNLSPGGCADLLAITYFFHNITHL